LVDGDIYTGDAFPDCLAPVTRAHAEDTELMIRRRKIRSGGDPNGRSPTSNIPDDYGAGLSVTRITAGACEYDFPSWTFCTTPFSAFPVFGAFWRGP
jgi:hypothetical protein